ncbi:LysR family transcriptional regulator [uncultured Acidaminococcus sp.]|uniref:LysR substrate-binding domain-containing protein n=1 Tax=uncultured Acidaminococcus sp. TaxID=352152 RepID=UPI002942AE52|nr:LysR family transcriptional regulator [uncultured Acidaminococcus sp.]
MELAQKMFLLAAEEMNFTKAAKRAFVTQQCLSEHISKLEKQLHTKLFLRGRHLQLTESGKAMVSTLRQIQHLEESLGHRIQEIEAGEIGEIRLGISTSRARLLLPRFLETFHGTYPQVHISITLGDTVQHIQLMKTQQLDLVLGLDAPSDPFLEEKLIGKEKLMVVGTLSFFRQYHLGTFSPENWKTGNTISLQEFKPFPLIGNREHSTLLELVQSCLRENHLDCPQPISISDISTQIQLCRLGHTATFCNDVLAYPLIREVQKDQEDPLLAFYIAGETHTMRSSILRLKAQVRTRYLEDFTNKLLEYMKKIQNG